MGKGKEWDGKREAREGRGKEGGLAMYTFL